MCKNRSSAKNLKSRFSVLFTFSTKRYPKSASFFVSLFMALLEIRKNSVQINDFFSFFCTESAYFGCEITPSKCNLFARWFFYLFFSVFYSLYSGFIKLLTILSKAVAKIRNNSSFAQKYYIKLPYFPNFPTTNFLIFPISTSGTSLFSTSTKCNRGGISFYFQCFLFSQFWFH